jgi:hypothetical protein
MRLSIFSKTTPLASPLGKGEKSELVNKYGLGKESPPFGGGVQGWLKLSFQSV